MKLTITGDSLKEIREKVMQAACDFLKYGVVKSEAHGSMVMRPQHSPAEEEFKRMNPDAKISPPEFRPDYKPKAPIAAELPAEVVSNSASVAEKAPGKRGRPPGWKKDPIAPRYEKQETPSELEHRPAKPAPIPGVADDNEEEPVEETMLTDTDVLHPEPKSQTQAPEISLSDLNLVVKAVCEKFGVATGREILTRFNVKTVKEIPKESYAEFKAYCTKKLGA